MIVGVLSILLFIGFTGYAWLRLDDLTDRVPEARPGGRVQRALIRQIGAMIGWWLVVTSASLALLRAEAPLTLPFFTLGALLVGLAIVSRRRGDAPMFWAKS